MFLWYCTMYCTSNCTLLVWNFNSSSSLDSISLLSSSLCTEYKPTDFYKLLSHYSVWVSSPQLVMQWWFFLKFSSYQNKYNRSLLFTSHWYNNLSHLEQRPDTQRNTSFDLYWPCTKFTMSADATMIINLLFWLVLFLV